MKPWEHAGHRMDDVTEFCVRCGVSLVAVADQRRWCVPVPGVTPINHILARRKLSALLKGVLSNV